MPKMEAKMGDYYLPCPICHGIHAVFERMQAEIERLRTEIWHEKALSGAIREVVVRSAKNRAEVIEECAQVAETFHCAQCGMDAATAIRALKEKQ